MTPVATPAGKGEEEPCPRTHWECPSCGHVVHSPAPSAPADVEAVVAKRAVIDAWNAAIEECAKECDKAVAALFDLNDSAATTAKALALDIADNIRALKAPPPAP